MHISTTIYHNYSHQCPVWFDSAIIKCIELKAKYRLRYEKFNNEHDLSVFKRLRKIIDEQIKVTHSKYLEDIQTSISADPEKFWTFIHSRKNNSRIPDNVIKKLRFPLIVDAFASIFLSIQILMYLSFLSRPMTITSTFNLSSQEENDTIEHLKNKMHSWPDAIPPFLVKDCAPVLVESFIYSFGTVF